MRTDSDYIKATRGAGKRRGVYVQSSTVAPARVSCKKRQRDSLFGGAVAPVGARGTRVLLLLLLRDSIVPLFLLLLCVYCVAVICVP